MVYILGFKSGARLRISILDGDKFVADLTSGIKERPSAPVQWYIEPGLVLSVSELEFVVPASVVVAEGPAA